MEQVFMAYKSKLTLSDKEFIENEARRWADDQAALQQSSTSVSERISIGVSKIANIDTSDQVGSIKGSIKQLTGFSRWVKLALKWAVVSSTPYCKCSQRWLSSRVRPILPTP